MKIFSCLIFCLLFYNVLSFFPKIKVENGTINEQLNISIISTSLSFVYYEYSPGSAYRVQVKADSSLDVSLLIIIKDENKIAGSIDIPKIENILAERTICPFYDLGGNKIRLLSLEVSTNSSVLTVIRILVYKLNNFRLEVNTKLNFTITKYSPSFFLFELNNTNIYNFHVESSDETCMIFSIQEAKCPINNYDTEIIELNSKAYQTVTTIGSITTGYERKYKSVYVVFIVDNACGFSALTKGRMVEKSFTLLISQYDKSYYLPVFGAIGFFLIFYLISPIISCIYMHCFYLKTRTLADEEVVIASPLENPVSYGSIIDHADIGTIHDRSGPSSSASNKYYHCTSENSYDSLSDAFSDTNVFRLNKNVWLSDFSRKNPNVLNRKYFLYFWYLIVISVFYGLPVVQLVIQYQEKLDNTGNQDMCYYNFRCTKPFYIFSAFNNVISNIGYVLLGILFTLLTWRREIYYQEGFKNRGIPQYYGLFYAMGVSLTMEGIMSACYHICPSSNNFQFDTAYMYILACLCMIKIYQTRHPDVNATAHSFFMTMALFIFVSVIGVVTVDNKIIFWVFFLILYLCICGFLTSEVYYMGCWKLDCKIFKRIYNMILIDKWKIFIPTYKRRMGILSFFNAVNFAIALYGIIKRPDNFQSFFLAVFMVNLLLYFGFYILMKAIHSEKFHKISLFYVIISIICWAPAIYCFINHPTDWQKSPSLSRIENKACLLLDFYDIHDIWHFLSAMSMFFSFMALQNMDDCLIHTERNKIAVF